MSRRTALNVMKSFFVTANLSPVRDRAISRIGLRIGASVAQSGNARFELITCERRSVAKKRSFKAEATETGNSAEENALSKGRAEESRSQAAESGNASRRRSGCTSQARRRAGSALAICHQL